MRRALYITSLVSSMLFACNPAPSEKSDAPPRDFAQEARDIAHNRLIIDTHIDIPYRLNKHPENIAERTEKGDFDYPRALEGGLDIAFMSVYTPADLGEGADAFAHANNMIKIVEAIVSNAPDKFSLVQSSLDAENNLKSGKIGLAMGMENGSPVGSDLDNLNYFHQKGVRYITLAHSRANQIADSSYDSERPNEGLSDFGREVVARMNDLGIMVDISHVSDEAFYDALAASRAPLLASHSSLRFFTPGFERNMSDDMLKALAEKGGVMMLNFGSSFLSEAANKDEKARSAAYKKALESSGDEDNDKTEERFDELYRLEHPYPFATLETVLDHIDHAVGLVGIDHIGLGSDFDGVGDSLPEDLKDVADYPNLVEGLLRRGYTNDDITKILSGNLLRLWRAVEAVAASSHQNTPTTESESPQP